MSSLTLEIGHEQQGVRAAYVDRPSLRIGLHNELSGRMFVEGGDLMFDPGTDLMFEAPESTYPGIKLEVL